MLLAVENLVVGFHMPGRDLIVVDGVSFALAEGEALAIVGESGSGKTQTAFSLLGLLARNGFATGSVRLEGRQLLGLGEAEFNKVRAQKIGMIFQDPMTSLNPYMRIDKQMTEVLATHRGMARRAAEAEAIRMLDAVQLPDAKNIARRFPHECSGGMRQRVMIAMALLCRPKLLVADEPTTALDVTVQAQMLELFRGLIVEFGTALIIITHDLGVVARLADHMAVMYAGRVVEAGSVEDLFYDPRHPYTQGLLRSTPHIGARRRRLSAITGAPPNMEHLPPGCAFAPRCGFVHEPCLARAPALDPVAAGRARACHHTGALPSAEAAP